MVPPAHSLPPAFLPPTADPASHLLHASSADVSPHALLAQEAQLLEDLGWNLLPIAREVRGCCRAALPLAVLPAHTS